MTKKILTYTLVGLVTLFFAVTVAGCVVRVRAVGKIAPGVMLGGRDISGMSVEEVEELIGGILPEVLTEIRCRFLPEMQKEVETAVIGLTENTESIRMSVQENELCMTVDAQIVRISVEDTIEEIIQKSREVKVWEWLYAKAAGKPFQIREAEAVFVWEEEYFGELLSVFTDLLERECVEAAVHWENEGIKVTESKRGFRIDTKKIWNDAETMMTEVSARLKNAPVEGLVLRFFLEGTALMPRLSTSQARACDTVIGEFTTGYPGAGEGRVQNIKAGAAKLHTKVILPGEEFSVAAALMPFTEANGYATGGTYIDGQLSESIGGGVCQLSTTLYNVLLQTHLDITMRYPHSMPVGYIPLGRDAAIAGDYKDLRFVNNTRVPVLLLCEATEDEVKVTLYGSEEAKRGNVTFESVIEEETKESVTVEVYRTEKAEGGAEIRDRVSVDKYRVKR